MAFTFTPNTTPTMSHTTRKRIARATNQRVAQFWAGIRERRQVAVATADALNDRAPMSVRRVMSGYKGEHPTRIRHVSLDYACLLTVILNNGEVILSTGLRAPVIPRVGRDVFDYLL